MPDPIIITDDSHPDDIAGILDGHGLGLVPRNYHAHPSGYLACAEPFPASGIIPEAEWPDRLAAQKELGSLDDLRELYYDVLQSLDQDGFSLCWAFSTVKALMYIRVLMGLVPLKLSAWYVAGMIKRWADQGGWGSESLSFVAKYGAPVESLCPSYRSSYATPETAANAMLHRVTEFWDGSEDRAANKRIMVSAFLMGLPPVLDFNHISHSMCGCRLVSLDPLTIETDNSWGPTSGTKGKMTLVGSKAIPDGICVPRVTLPSLALRSLARDEENTCMA